MGQFLPLGKLMPAHQAGNRLFVTENRSHMTSGAVPSGALLLPPARLGALLLIAAFPAVATLVDGTANGYWGLLILMGVGALASMRAGHWRDLFSDADIKWPILLILAYVAVASFNYMWLDHSEFAESRLQRHTLLLGGIFVLILLWRLRPAPQHALLAMGLNALALGAYAVYEASRGAARVDVEVTHAIHFGNTALALAAFSLASALSARHWRAPVLYVGSAGFVAGLTASILSGSRAGWLGLGVAMALLLGFWGCRRHWRRVAIGSLAVCALLFSLWHTDIVQQRLHQAVSQWEQFEGDKYKDSSVAIRMVLWENAWAVFQESPVWGGGFSAFNERIQDRIAAGELPRYYTRYKTEPHSEYLYQLSTRGLVGLAAFVALFGWFAWRSGTLIVKGDRNQEAIAVGPLFMSTIIAVAGATITILDQRYVMNLSGYLLALSAYVLSAARRSTGGAL